MSATVTPTPVVMIPTARPTFAVEVAQERADAARKLVAGLGATVSGPTKVVMTPEDVRAAASDVTNDAALVINVCASFSDASPALQLYQGLDAPALLWAFREPGSAGERLWLNSLCGANLFGHAIVGSGGAARLLYGDPDEPAVRVILTQALRGELPPAPTLPTAQRERAPRPHVRRVLDGLRGRRIGVVGDAPDGFTPCEYDATLLDRLFGLRIEQLTVEQMLNRSQSVGVAAREYETRDALAAQPSLANLDPEQVNLAAGVTTALRTWIQQEMLSAVAVRCWPEFPADLGVCPCSALSRLADAGTPTACERDVYGAATMLLTEAVGGGTTYLVDLVELLADSNDVRVWHCGSAATTLAADPSNATQDVHCNRKIGVTGNFPLKTGPVIMSRLAEDPDPNNGTGIRLLLTAGQSIPGPNRFQGNTATIHLSTDAEQFVSALVSGGFPHHMVLAWTDVRQQLRTAADVLGIPVVEW